MADGQSDNGAEASALALFGYRGFQGRRTDVEGALGVADMLPNTPILLCKKGSDEERPAIVDSRPYVRGSGWVVKIGYPRPTRGPRRPVDQLKLSRLGLVPKTPAAVDPAEWADEYVKADPSRSA